MPPPEVSVREYKQPALEGGTLLVSVPHAGIGNILLTDYILEQHRMDQVAVLDSDAFPPLATVHHGRPRFPMRLHADAGARLAVLRSEFTPPLGLARPLARAVLGWAAGRGVGRIIVLDAVHTNHAQQGAEAPLRRWFLAVREATRQEAREAKLEEFGEGVMGGLSATLLLEGRFHDADVVALLVELREPLDDARSVTVFARALPALVPGLRLDQARMERDLERTEAAVRRLRQAAQRAVEREGGPAGEGPPMFG